MASVRKLQSTITWAKTLLKNQPLDISGQEPGVNFGNMTLGVLFSPPFRWAFNRFTDTFQIAAGQSDTVRQLPNFAGSIEDAWIVDASGNVYPINKELSLPIAATSHKARPTSVAAQFDDGQGNITFRTKEQPDQNYTLGVSYQGKATILQSFGDTLGPWPDHFAFVFEWGYVTVSSLLLNDARFPTYERLFIGKLLALQSGLSDQEMSIFLGNWERLTKTAARGSTAVSMANQARMQ